MDKLTKKEVKGKKEDEELMHGFKEEKNSMFSSKLIGVLLVVVFLGIGSGYFLSGQGGAGDGTPGKKLLGGGAEKGKVYGEQDTSSFEESAPDGVLKKGGIDGEGQYHLVRPGGETKNVYITSSNVDLSLFIDRKVKVWGATQTAQKAGWLMDVGRVQVLE